MDSLLIVVLIAVAGVVLSGRRPARESQIIYVVAEPEPSSGLGCLPPLIVIGFVLFVLYAAG
jgi:hypothetical protein